jgi:hypothetical protein
VSVSDGRQDPVWSYIKFLKQELGILPTVKTTSQMKRESRNALLSPRTYQPNLTEQEERVADLDGYLLRAYLEANDAVEAIADPTAYAFYSIMNILVDGQAHSWKDLLSVTNIPKKSLDRRLSDLVALGLVRKQIIPAFPPRTQYTTSFSEEEKQYLRTEYELKATRERLIFATATRALYTALDGNSAGALEALRELMNARNRILSLISLETTQLTTPLKSKSDKKERARVTALKSFKSIEALYFYWLPLSLLRLPELREQAREFLESEIRSLSQEDEVKLAISSVARTGLHS